MRKQKQKEVEVKEWKRQKEEKSHCNGNALWCSGQHKGAKESRKREVKERKGK